MTKKDLLEAIEDMPIAFNVVNFFEWVRANRLWSNLYTAMFQLK